MTAKGIECADIAVVTGKFTEKYPSSKYTVFVVSGAGNYKQGYSGSSAAQLGSKNSQVPDAATVAMHHFYNLNGTEAEAFETEKEAIRDATQALMKKLRVCAPPLARGQQAAGRKRHTVQETEHTMSSNYVCDYNNLCPTNCRTENTSVPRPVDKLV